MLRASKPTTYHCNADGTDETSTGDVIIGSMLNICVYSTYLGVLLAVTDLELKQGTTLLSTCVGGGSPDFVTKINEITLVEVKQNVQVVSMLMTPGIYDTAGGRTISASGSATISYRRHMFKKS